MERVRDIVVDESVQRIRRGCIGAAALLISIIFVLIMSSGNLAWSLLLILPIALIIGSRLVK